MEFLLRNIVSMKSRIDKTEYKFKKYLYGIMFWYKNGLSHRENDKPAVIYGTGNMAWYKNGERHRGNNLPAIIYSDGRLCWYIDGEFIKEYKK